MFPIGDDNSDRHITPVVNYAIIGVNILVFATSIAATIFLTKLIYFTS
ncbi:MAG: hypothetical protein IPI64_03000 [Chloracidobacterium sp.]|nr:hypothetical protein [Chloracidobacterium sp.]